MRQFSVGLSALRAARTASLSRLALPTTKASNFSFLRGQKNFISSSKSSNAAGSATAAVEGAAEQGSRRAVGYWLAGTAGTVFVMVCIGGATRLTRSGLSIVEWKPAGEIFPSNDQEWQVEFDKYKAFPEYKKVNSMISLEEFKFIYFMEWFHRMWGRGIGLAFAGPLAYFAATRSIPKGLGPRLGLMLGLGAAQGGVGWWMVKSGLEHERFEGNSKIPRVSPYRLATHVSRSTTRRSSRSRSTITEFFLPCAPAFLFSPLVLSTFPSRAVFFLAVRSLLHVRLQLAFAFTVYSLLAYTSFDLLAKPLTRAEITPQALAAVRKIKLPTYLSAGIIALTAASGAFVAGNDAGHAYNDWPFMAGKLVPEEIWDGRLGLLNVFENTATVQFDHRMLAYTTLGSIGVLHAAAKRAGGMRLMPAPVKRGLMVVSGLVAAQIALGISTLMLYVPVSLGTAHQGGALALLTGALYLVNGVRRVEREALKLGVNVSVSTTAATAAAPSPAKASAAAAAAFIAMVSSSSAKQIREEAEDA